MNTMVATFADSAFATVGSHRSPNCNTPDPYCTRLVARGGGVAIKSSYWIMGLSQRRSAKLGGLHEEIVSLRSARRALCGREVPLGGAVDVAEAFEEMPANGIEPIMTGNTRILIELVDEPQAVG